jgi:cell division protein FtsW (lipid II flippase)
LSTTALARLSTSLDWYSLNYLGLWRGHAAVLLGLILLMAFAFVLYRQSRKIGSDTQRLIVQGGCLIYVLNLLWAIAGTSGLVLSHGHYGVPFLSAGQMSLMAVLLLLVAYGSPGSGDVDR